MQIVHGGLLREEFGYWRGWSQGWGLPKPRDQIRAAECRSLQSRFRSGQDFGEGHSDSSRTQDSVCCFFEAPWGGDPAFMAYRVNNPTRGDTHVEVVFYPVQGFGHRVFGRKDFDAKIRRARL